MRVDALLFDKDGTLFEFAATWEAFAAALLNRLAAGDMGKAAELGRAIGFDTERSVFQPDSVVIAGTPQEIAQGLLPLLPSYDLATLIELINTEAATTPLAPAVPLVPFLDSLRAHGLKLGVATNDAEMPALQHLEAVGIRQKFDFIAGFDSGHGAKPGPGQMLAFAKQVDVDPARIAMVGDSTHDLLAGRAAGMTTIGVLTGVAVQSDLARHADVIFPDIGHIPDWLRS